jgi:hypothetical protein
MIETTLEIRMSGADGECSILSNAAGEVAEQAELLAFALYVGRVKSLGGLDPPDSAVDAAEYLAVARFVDAARGPRLYFRLKGSDPAFADRAVAAALAALPNGAGLASELLAQLGATGQIRRDNEFDVALAAADVAWRYDRPPDEAWTTFELECPACGNSAEEAGFDRRLWPSDSAVLCKCGRCGTGVWRRGSRAPRVLSDDVWSAMESLRSELSVMAQVQPSLDGATGALLDNLKRVFTDNGWPFTEVQGAPVLLGVLSGPAGSWSFYAQAVEEKDLILLYSICPQRVPPDRRLAVAEYLTRANYGLAAGNFELDLDDGEVRYKSALPIQGDGPDAIALKRLMRANGIAMETYLPGITAVIAGASSASVE